MQHAVLSERVEENAVYTVQCMPRESMTHL